MAEKIKPDPSDYAAAEKNYCERHPRSSPVLIWLAAETDTALAAELYQLAQAYKLIRLAREIHCRTGRSQP